MIERRFAELRAAPDRTIEGVVVKYGDVAQLPFGREVIHPGAFRPIGDVILNRGHDRRRPLARTGAGLEFDDTEERLLIRAMLPPTRDADDVLTLVNTGVLRGLSVEMAVKQDDFRQRTRHVEKAKLVGIGVVDRPAYRESLVSTRQRAERTTITGKVNLDEELACRCRKGCDHIRINADAMDDAIAEAIRGDREITAFFSGAYDKPIASVSAGTLTLKRTGTTLAVGISTLPDSGPVRDFLETFAFAKFVARPYFPDDMSKFQKQGTTAVFSHADLRAIEIAALTGPSDGLVEVEVDEAPLPRPAARRRRVWL